MLRFRCMEINPAFTAFAAVERADREKIDRQRRLFDQNEILIKIADAVSKMLLVLNAERQIVYANRLFLDFLNIEDRQKLIGMRPGEAMNCIHSDAGAGGCGTSEFCRTCGAVNAIFSAHRGKAAEEECRIVSKDGDAYDLRVTATPYKQDGEEFTIFAIADISNEKRRQMLERVFFHDVLNSATAISGISSLLKEIHHIDELDNVAKTLNRTTEILIDEIISQREISVAERGDLEVSFSHHDSLVIVKELMAMYSRYEANSQKRIVLHEKSMNTRLYTDQVLLRRILGNMIKNALEASMPGGAVTLSCNGTGDKAHFSVHNANYIDREIQLQLFKRSFTTKGQGRGIGTYSMKLFGEKYLKGRVWFESSRENGTTFYLEIPVQVQAEGISTPQ